MSYGQERILDLSGEQRDPPLPVVRDGQTINKVKIVSGKVVRFRRGDVKGITFHQTWCVFGTSDQQVKAAGGDAVLAKHRRALNVAAQMVAMTTGKAVQVYPLDWYVYHGNKLSGLSYGLEIEGKFPGLMSGRGLMVPELVEASRAGAAYLVEKGRAAGHPVEIAWGHRQSNGKKPDDPCEEIWRKVVIEFALPKLGMRLDPTTVFDQGRKIPAAWGPGGVGPY